MSTGGEGPRRPVRPAGSRPKGQGGQRINQSEPSNRPRWPGSNSTRPSSSRTSSSSTSGSGPSGAGSSSSRSSGAGSSGSGPRGGGPSGRGPNRKGQQGQRRPQKKPWARRIITTSALILIIAALVYGIVAGVRHVGTLIQDHEQTTEEATLAAPVEIPECAAPDVDFSLSVNPSVAKVGQSVEVDLELANVGEKPCSLNSGEITLQLKGDGDVFWEPIKCDKEWGIPLLLAPGQPWSTSLEWDGLTQVDCETVMVEWQEASGEPWFEAHQMAPGKGTFKMIAKLEGGEEAKADLIIN